MRNRISTEEKSELINKLKNEGLTVEEAISQYGVSKRNIKRWMSGDGVKNVEKSKEDDGEVFYVRAHLMNEYREKHEKRKGDKKWGTYLKEILEKEINQ